MARMVKEQGGLNQINDEDIHTSMFTCFLSQETKRFHQALKDPSWIEAMREELLHFKIQKFWVYVGDIIFGSTNKELCKTFEMLMKDGKLASTPIDTEKPLLKDPDGKGVDEEGIDYEEVFAPVARIEAIRLFLAYASFMGFVVYQMDVKSAFLYGTIEEEIYVCQPQGFEDPDYPDMVYKVVKALYGLHQAPRSWYETLANYLLENGFQR
nr:hypothetical protein [Tanacetum cinerariifolium]